MRQTVKQAAAAAAVIGSAFVGQAAQAADYATVVSSTPVTVSVPVSRQVCSDGAQLVRSAPSGAGAVIGAIAGGVLGNSVGGGFGRAAATGVGAVAGAAIGNQVEANGTPVSEVPVRRCQTATAYENRIVGYDVMYDYAGQRYSTRMNRDPGKQMAVNVQPAENGSSSLPAPVYNDQYAQPQAAYQPVPPPQPTYYQPLPPTVYYDAPAPYYAPSYAPYYSPYYAAPVIGLGIGLGLGFGFGHHYRGGGHRHWR